MNLQQTVASFFPRSLLLILASSLPIALACNQLSQARDVHMAPESATPAAVSARLTPIAHVLPVADDTKVATAAPLPPAAN
jgi:hypothetical protein